MSQLLGLTMLSALITGVLLVPFIDFLYKVKLRRRVQHTKDPFNQHTPLFDKYHNTWKVGTPFGGGILIIVVVIVLTLWSYGLLGVKVNPWVLAVVMIGLLGYGLLGLYDDMKKLVGGDIKTSFFGLRFRHKFIIQWILALVISSIFYYKLGYSFFFIRGIGQASVGLLFIPLGAFVIISFTNAFNIADGLDGLASGLMLICLIAFLAISAAQLDSSIGILIAILMGSVGAFLYFNTYKARLWLGDVGSLPLGAMLAIIGLLTGKVAALAVIGGVFVLEAGSSLLQMASKKYLKRKLFPAAPVHLYLQKKGWEEPKIVMRAWLLGFFFAVLGLYIALIH